MEGNSFRMFLTEKGPTTRVISFVNPAPFQPVTSSLNADIVILDPIRVEEIRLRNEPPLPVLLSPLSARVDSQKFSDASAYAIIFLTKIIADLRIFLNNSLIQG